jgi:two-component system, cell cycle sensor histidine kinase and response regulator CckA
MVQTILLVAAFAIVGPPLHAQPLPAEGFDKVVLQLAWYHKFQFAGYYAAQEQGYYTVEGLDVDIREGGPGLLPVDAVLAGDADFGTAASEIMCIRMQGKPVVVVAAIMQHSPWALVARADSDLSSLDDILGKTISINDNYRDVEVMAMFKEEHLPTASMTLVKRIVGPDNLLNGSVDARISYLTNLPFALEEKGGEARVFRPIHYGIDFYGDTLFTSEAQIQKHPARVAAFRRASLRGWQYAMEHSEELVDYVFGSFYADKTAGPNTFSRAHLLFEAQIMSEELMHPVMVEIGHMNPHRWRRIADAYADFDIAEALPSLDGFIYNPNPAQSPRGFYVVIGLFLGVFCVGVVARIWNKRLHHVVTQRTKELKESAKKHERLVNNLVDSFLYRHDVEGKMSYVSPSITQVLGYTPQEFLVAYDQYLTDHPENEKVEIHTQQSVLGIEQPTHDLQIYHKDGSTRWLEVSETPVRDEQDTVVAVEGVAHDISKRKRADDALRTLVETTSTLYGSAFFGTMAVQLSKALKAEIAFIGELKDAHGTVIKTVALAVDGVPADNFECDLAGTPCAEVTDDCARSYASGVSEQFPEDAMLKTMGAEGYVGVPLFNSEGTTLGIMAALYRKPVPDTDFAETILQIFASRVGAELERSRSHDALVESEERFRTVTEQAGDAFFLIDPDTTRFVDANRRACDVLQYSREELLALSVPDIGPPEQSGRFKETTGKGEPGDLATIEAIHKKRDGVTFPVEIRSSIVEIGGKKRVLALARDITERKRAEAEQRAQGQRLADILEGTHAGFWDWKIPTGELILNERWAEIIGFTLEELAPIDVNTWISHVHPDDLADANGQLERHLSGASDYSDIVFRQTHKNGSLVWVNARGKVVEWSDDGKPLRMCGTHLDITDRKKLELQLRQAQKMEAVGQLAGGIAHDFNNLLQAILGYGDLALEEVEAGSSAHESITEVMLAGERAQTLIGQLLAFSRRQVLEMKDVNLNDVVADLTKMIRRLIGEHIALDVLGGHNLGTVWADRGQIEQILMNLCVNARDAMPKGGTISIETENVRIDEEYCEIHPWATPGRYVLLSVTDSGCGMDKDTLANIFEPFFTTKGVGKGTGLGLSTVYGLVKQHNGMVNPYSEVGKGTAFKIYFPLVERSADIISERLQATAQRGSETILLAEDEETVRKLTVNILERAGYTVLPTRDGEEALLVFKQHTDKIDLALLDVMMPNLGGRAVYEEIRATHPDIPMLFSSGYSMSSIHTNFVLDEGMQLIQKPYQRDALLRKVRDILDASG